jgi:hypothetical protein
MCLMCVTGSSGASCTGSATASTCANNTSLCCTGGQTCKVCNDKNSFCCPDTKPYCRSYSPSTAGEPEYACCVNSDDVADQFGICCSSTRKTADNKCCPSYSSVCGEGSTAICCPTGFGCDPKDDGKCKFICGNNPEGAISINGVQQPGGPVYCDCGPDTVPPCSTGICVITTITTSSGPQEVAACRNRGTCLQWDTQATYYPNNQGAETLTTPVYCTSPLGPDTDTCPSVTQYCYTGADADTKTSWRRKGVLPYVDANSFSSCDISDCMAKAGSFAVKDYIDFNTTDATTACSWLEAPDTQFNLCTDASATCPKANTSSTDCCNPVTGEYTTETVASTCDVCGFVGTCVNPGEPTDVANCTPCSGHGTCTAGVCACTGNWGGQFCESACLATTAPWASMCPAGATCVSFQADGNGWCGWSCAAAGGKDGTACCQVNSDTKIMGTQTQESGYCPLPIAPLATATCAAKFTQCGSEGPDGTETCDCSAPFCQRGDFRPSWCLSVNGWEPGNNLIR